MSQETIDSLSSLGYSLAAAAKRYNEAAEKLREATVERDSAKNAYLEVKKAFDDAVASLGIPE